MESILIIGNYGTDNKLNGQTARTRTITQTIKKIYDLYKIDIIDTKKIELKTIFNFIKLAIQADKIIIMPARGSIKTIIYTLDFLHLLNKTYYIAIGGWIYDYLLDNPKLKKKIRKINCTFVQIKSLNNNLLSLNINSCFLPNYRIYDDEIRFKNKINKYVIYSRIREDKGILIAIDAINMIKNVYLDIYGPIDDDFKEIFYKKIQDSKHVRYCGILNNNVNIVETISQYKTLLFPTFYDGEGFPGTILESMTAGVPVIASDWKYNSEIIQDKKNGFIVETKSINDIKNKIELIENKLVNIDDLSKNCIKLSKQYTEENAIKILKNIIGD